MHLKFLSGSIDGMKPSCFATTIPKSKFIPLKELLLEQGFTLAIPQYTVYQGKKSGISVTLYQSGKLTVQGKEKDEFIEFYLEPHILETVEYTNPQASADYTNRIGVDEAGKGDFFGPLCVTALYAEQSHIDEFYKLGIKDSKRIGDAQALALTKKITAMCETETLSLYPPKYNELYARFHNLNRMLAWCHATVIHNLHQKTGCSFATIDQFGAEHLVATALKKRSDTIQLQQQHKGEEDIVIAAASIVARGAFLSGLSRLSDSIGTPLLKGASSAVKNLGRTLAAKGVLEQVCKTHFKTYNEVR